MTDRKTLLARLARWRDKLREVAARLARVRGSSDGEREAAAVEAAMLAESALADAWAADGFRWRLLGERLLAESAVTVEQARRHFFEGHGETPPLLVLDRLIDRLVTHRPQLDPAVLAASVQRRLFDGDGWRPWLASPTPRKTLLKILRWCAGSAQRVAAHPH